MPVEPSDELDITLALVDGLLDRGPGHGVSPHRYRETILIAPPFIDVWGADFDVMTGVQLENVPDTTFRTMSGSDEHPGVYCLGRLDVVGPKQLRKAGVPLRSRTIIRDRCIFVDQSGMPHGRAGGFEMDQERSGRKAS